MLHADVVDAEQWHRFRPVRPITTIELRQRLLGALLAGLLNGIGVTPVAE